jgi:hypothetical protein
MMPMGDVHRTIIVSYFVEIIIIVVTTTFKLVDATYDAVTMHALNAVQRTVSSGVHTRPQAVGLAGPGQGHAHSKSHSQRHAKATARLLHNK